MSLPPYSLLFDIINFVVFGVDVSVACCLEKKAMWVYISAEWNALQV